MGYAFPSCHLPGVPRLFIAIMAIAIPRSDMAPAAELSKGHRILLEQGLQIQAVAFIGPSTGSGTFDLNTFKAANFTTVDRTWRSQNTVLGPPPGFPWGFWLNRIFDPIISPSDEVPYAPSLVSVKLLDEQDLNSAQVRADTKAWFDTTRPSFPNTLLFTNQSTGRQLSDASLQAYMVGSKPDMLCFDTYAFTKDGGPLGGSPTLLYGDMQRYRTWALRGNDQSSTQPIPYGLYLQTYQGGNYRAPSDSEMRLNQFAAWTFGYTFVDAFTYNWFGDTLIPDGTSLFFNADERYPLQAYYQIAETNRQSRLLGPALVRLLSTNVRFVPGRHPNSNSFDTDGTQNAIPTGMTVGSVANGWGHAYITDLVAENVGTKNHQQSVFGTSALPGDVLLGFFRLLDESFDGNGWSDEAYFMVLNGLSDNGLLDADGQTLTDTHQRITITFDFAASGISSLLRLSRETGEIELVSLIHDGGSKYHLDLTIDGGTGDLFKFNTGAPFVVPEPSGVWLTVFPIAFVYVSIRQLSISSNASLQTQTHNAGRFNTRTE